MKRYLLTPGPTPVPDSVRLAGAQPVIHHRTVEFSKLFRDVTSSLQSVFQTKNDLFIFSASGTGGMESCVVNFLSIGDRVLVVNTGAFGRRWENILKVYGLKPEVIEYPWGKAARIEEIREKLEENPEIKAVFTQLTETSTGVVNDIESMAKITAQSKAILVVDAVSGLGGQEIKTDEWGVDVVVAGSQKGLMLPPGLSFVSVSKKAWNLMEESKLPKFYWSFKTYKKFFNERGETPYTPAVNLLFSLQDTLRIILEEGLKNVFARHALLARAARAGVISLGLELFAEVPCDVVTSVKVPEGVDGISLVKRMRDEYGVSIAGGQREFKGKIFRMAHMGYMDKFDEIIALAALEMMLNKLGYKVELGKGVAAAEKEFLKK
ncbi:alanine--glyoxylate aminotransferase family protein [bacterium]|nr:alanine--glyoxylate aminotransferase family protein [bacterium]